MSRGGPTVRELLDREREGFERTLAVLREENATLRRMLEGAAQRADQLVTELVKSVAMTAPAPPAPLRPAPPAGTARPTSKDPITGLGNLLDSVPIGHPEGEFTTVRAASLMATTEDDGGAEADDGPAAAA